MIRIATAPVFPRRSYWYDTPGRPTPRTLARQGTTLNNLFTSIDEMKRLLLLPLFPLMLMMSSCQDYDGPDANVDVSIRESEPYKRLMEKCNLIESSSHWRLAYVLSSSDYIVIVFGDCMGSIYYRADSYELSDNGYKLISDIGYRSRADFSEPTLTGKIYSVRSKKNNKIITFDITKGGEYDDDKEDELGLRD